MLKPIGVLATYFLAVSLACAPISAQEKDGLFVSGAQCRTVVVRDSGTIDPTVIAKATPADQTLKLNRVLTSAPPCAGEIVVFDGSRILMKDGRTLRLEGDTTREVGGFYAFDRGQLHTKVEGLPDGLGRFVNSYRAEALHKNSANAEIHIGVWERNNLYHVNAFMLQGGRFSGELLPVLTSTKPIRHAAYAGMPDSPSGTIFLVVEDSSGSVNLASYAWGHRSFSHLFAT